MKIVLDTCVLFPTVMREMLLGVTASMAWTPIWSERILEEWQRAAIKLGATGPVQAASEIAFVRAAWPDACVAWPSSLEARLWLPDRADCHVLAAAISGSADVIVTLNKKDFPRHILGEEGVDRRDPDALLYMAFTADPSAVEAVAERVLNTANRLSGQEWTIRPLLKKARLPKLAKALGATASKEA